ncbi:hypothetical protein [Streptomyces sp. NPDC005969]|uniref:hypothetical protein n=1 Tax=Streptomyces sp. NPDC005969 TaxID=3156722 RepID=UPI0033CED67A
MTTFALVGAGPGLELAPPAAEQEARAASHARPGQRSDRELLLPGRPVDGGYVAQ